jgi:hypothetical protein
VWMAFIGAFIVSFLMMAFVIIPNYKEKKVMANYFKNYENKEPILSGVGFLIVGKTTTATVDSINYCGIGDLDKDNGFRDVNIPKDETYTGTVEVGEFELNVTMSFYEDSLYFLSITEVPNDLERILGDKYKEKEENYFTNQLIFDLCYRPSRLNRNYEGVKVRSFGASFRDDSDGEDIYIESISMTEKILVIRELEKQKQDSIRINSLKKGI